MYRSLLSKKLNVVDLCTRIQQMWNWTVNFQTFFSKNVLSHLDLWFLRIQASALFRHRDAQSFVGCCTQLRSTLRCSAPAHFLLKSSSSALLNSTKHGTADQTVGRTGSPLFSWDRTLVFIAAGRVTPVAGRCDVRGEMELVGSGAQCGIPFVNRCLGTARSAALLKCCCMSCPLAKWSSLQPPCSFFPPSSRIPTQWHLKCGLADYAEGFCLSCAKFKVQIWNLIEIANYSYLALCPG